MNRLLKGIFSNTTRFSPLLGSSVRTSLVPWTTPSTDCPKSSMLIQSPPTERTKFIVVANPPVGDNRKHTYFQRYYCRKLYDSEEMLHVFRNGFVRMNFSSVPRKSDGTWSDDLSNNHGDGDGNGNGSNDNGNKGESKLWQLCLAVITGAIGVYGSYILWKIVSGPPKKINTISGRLWLWATENRFAGRSKTLDDIFQFFRGNHKKASKIVVVHGFAGMGKTAVATKYAYTQRDSYVNIIMLFAESKETSLGRLKIALHSLGVSQVDRKKYKELCTIFREKINNVKHKTLLIFDNVDEPNSWNVVKDLLPNNKYVDVIITSRTKNVPLHQHGMEVKPKLIPVRKLDDDETVSLIEITLDDKKRPFDTREDFVELAEVLVGFPLEVLQVCKYLNDDEKKSIKKFCEKYRESDEEKKLVFTSDVQSNYQKQVLDVELDPRSRRICNTLDDTIRVLEKEFPFVVELVKLYGYVGTTKFPRDMFESKFICGIPEIMENMPKGCSKRYVVNQVKRANKRLEDFHFIEYKKEDIGNGEVMEFIEVNPTSQNVFRIKHSLLTEEKARKENKLIGAIVNILTFLNFIEDERARYLLYDIELMKNMFRRRAVNQKFSQKTMYYVALINGLYGIAKKAQSKKHMKVIRNSFSLGVIGGGTLTELRMIDYDALITYFNNFLTLSVNGNVDPTYQEAVKSGLRECDVIRTFNCLGVLYLVNGDLFNGQKYIQEADRLIKPWHGFQLMAIIKNNNMCLCCLTGHPKEKSKHITQYFQSVKFLATNRLAPKVNEEEQEEEVSSERRI